MRRLTNPFFRCDNAGKRFIERMEPRRLLAAIGSDETVSATIASVSEVDSYSITLAVGDSLSAMVTDTLANSFSPRVRIFSPNSTLLRDVTHTTGLRVTVAPVTLAGTYTIEVSDNGANNTGNYAITVVRPRGSHAPNDGNGGLIRSGERKTGVMSLGDQDVFQMQVTQGDTVVIAFAETATTNFWGAIDAYAPDGSLVAENQDSAGTRITFVAAATGTFTFVTYDDYNYYAGSYGLTAFKSTGVQHDDATDQDFASLRSGEREVGLMALGDMDVFQMQVAQGDTVVISLAETVTNNFWGKILAYGPDGSLITSDLSSAGTRIRFEAASSGAYTFLVYDDYGYYAGTYAVSAFKSSGAQHDDLTDDDFATLASGQRKQGAINLGDSDVFQMQVTQGDHVIVSLAETLTTNFWGRIMAFGPDGAFIAESAHSASTRLSFQAATGGTFTFLVLDDYGYYTGRYAVSAFKSTGTIAADALDIDGGSVASGAMLNGTANVGDLDIYRVNATAGQAVTIRVNDFGNTSAWPAVAVYQPDGEYVGFVENSTTAVYDFTPAVSGEYRFVVYESYGYYAYRYGLSVNAAAVTADTVAPRALQADFAFNDAAHPVTIYFSEAITGLTVADMSLVNTTTGVQVSSVSIAVNNNNYSATLTFPGLLNARLTEGNYVLTLNNASVQDLSGNNLNGGLTYNFHVLTGDVNRDRKVDFDDLLVIAQNYGKLGRIFSTGNLDYSAGGEVVFDDLLALAQRYGNTLAVGAKPSTMSRKRSGFSDVLL